MDLNDRLARRKRERRAEQKGLVKAKQEQARRRLTDEQMFERAARLAKRYLKKS